VACQGHPLSRQSEFRALRPLPIDESALASFSGISHRARLGLVRVCPQGFMKQLEWYERMGCELRGSRSTSGHKAYRKWKRGTLQAPARDGHARTDQLKCVTTISPYCREGGRVSPVVKNEGSSSSAPHGAMRKCDLQEVC
jgi:hypothetical protein